MSSFFRTQLETYLKTLEVADDNVVDIGGAQFPVKGRTKSWNVKNYLVIDNGEGKFEEFNKEYLNVDIQDGISDDLQNKFDKAFMLEVAEYLYNPVAAIYFTNQLLKKGGELIISFPFLYPIHPPIGKDYLRYTRYGAIKILKELGFEIVEYIPRLIKNKELWYQLMVEEGYRFDRSVDPAFLQETGCIIRAKKK